MNLSDFVKVILQDHMFFGYLFESCKHISTLWWRKEKSEEMKTVLRKSTKSCIIQKFSLTSSNTVFSKWFISSLYFIKLIHALNCLLNLFPVGAAKSRKPKSSYPHIFSSFWRRQKNFVSTRASAYSWGYTEMEVGLLSLVVVRCARVRLESRESSAGVRPQQVQSWNEKAAR